ncbi:arginyltransferase [Thiohalobacter sp. IOR34]|uniref:arginyltransferase n=1 Tax=Thiohalobacter sp. IOR34 TaxID=3057176 RepID=UPI0025B0FE31|nr:arginyltransferase [Thiohalobacter sp. IOR34]WJW74390.1 arginyltransferase [Thiohalobacter sp. IOR34]
MIRLLQDPPHPCSYLAGHEASNQWADPARIDNRVYGRLLAHGFRRSGSHVYRPACPACQACVPVRLAVSDFRPARRHRRCLRRNADLEQRILPGRFSEEYFALYRRYLDQRHPGGGMENPAAADFRNFLLGNWSETLFIEFRDRGRLLAVAVSDQVEDALSAVYTFYDPDESPRGLGTLAILAQIGAARQRGLDWLYLGYWIAASPKMAYKAGFRPLQGLRDGRWEALQADGGWTGAP